MKADFREKGGKLFYQTMSGQRMCPRNGPVTFQGGERLKRNADSSMAQADRPMRWVYLMSLGKVMCPKLAMVHFWMDDAIFCVKSNCQVRHGTGSATCIS